jgi:hypothetical protein
VFLVLSLGKAHVSCVNVAAHVDVHPEVRGTGVVVNWLVVLPLHQFDIGSIAVPALVYIPKQHGCAKSVKVSTIL